MLLNKKLHFYALVPTCVKYLFTRLKMQTQGNHSHSMLKMQPHTREILLHNNLKYYTQCTDSIYFDHWNYFWGCQNCQLWQQLGSTEPLQLQAWKCRHYLASLFLCSWHSSLPSLSQRVIICQKLISHFRRRCQLLSSIMSMSAT